MVQKCDVNICEREAYIPNQQSPNCWTLQLRTLSHAPDCYGVNGPGKLAYRKLLIIYVNVLKVKVLREIIAWHVMI